jgi:hypothetical protein
LSKREKVNLVEVVEKSKIKKNRRKKKSNAYATGNVD